MGERCDEHGVMISLFKSLQMPKTLTQKSLVRCPWTPLLAAVVLVAGCGGPKIDYTKVDLVPAGGKVTMDGNPLPNVTVVFEADGGQFSAGKTDAFGQYELRFDSVKKGVTPGAKLVRITSLPVGEEEVSSEEISEGGAPVRAKETIPRFYNVESTLRVEVLPKQRQYDFNLTSR